ncbi:hypothetical protein IWQ60_010251 [Tieghemiomyces parasiticus]|uniref:Kelch repeat protein n=1 Tax=Tieghemiomyces parasiticus TaxID=78921 RepID=A0A9W7ZLN6_9FUNG|nr:hypothetical protein IWQ60_010251 [Tieghemiomyces parasiticus]
MARLRLLATVFFLVATTFSHLRADDTTSSSIVTLPAVTEHGFLVKKDTLFILGGRTSVDGTLSSNYLQEDYRLPLVNLFNTSSPPWTKAASASKLPLVSGAVALNVSDVDVNIFTVYGGYPAPSQAETPPLYSRILVNNYWSTRDADDGLGRWYGASGAVSAAINYAVYFGGVEPTSLASVRSDPSVTVKQSRTTMYYQATTIKQHTVPVQDYTPSSRFRHTGVMVNGTHYAVTGGISFGNDATTDEVHLLDTYSLTWSVVPTAGATWKTLYASTVVGRYGHAATLIGRNMLFGMGQTGTTVDDQLGYGLAPRANNVTNGPPIADQPNPLSNELFVYDVETQTMLDVYNLKFSVMVPSDAKDFSRVTYLGDPVPNKNSASTVKIILLSTLIPAGIALVTFVIWWFKVRRTKSVIDPMTNLPVKKRITKFYR